MKKIIISLLFMSFSSVAFSQVIISQKTETLGTNNLNPNVRLGEKTTIVYDNNSQRFITRFFLSDGRVWRHVMLSQSRNSETSSSPIITIEYDNYE